MGNPQSSHDHHNILKIATHTHTHIGVIIIFHTIHIMMVYLGYIKRELQTLSFVVDNLMPNITQLQ